MVHLMNPNFVSKVTKARIIKIVIDGTVKAIAAKGRTEKRIIARDTTTYSATSANTTQEPQ